MAYRIILVSAPLPWLWLPAGPPGDASANDLQLQGYSHRAHEWRGTRNHGVCDRLGTLACQGRCSDHTSSSAVCDFSSASGLWWYYYEDFRYDSGWKAKENIKRNVKDVKDKKLSYVLNMMTWRKVEEVSHVVSIRRGRWYLWNFIRDLWFVIRLRVRTHLVQKLYFFTAKTHGKHSSPCLSANNTIGWMQPAFSQVLQNHHTQDVLRWIF